ncbi:MAG: choice-of-anchor B family protein [Colwellia polaris]|jgi:choice-of-anchor B domain-containing protein|uniref:choice-of-anchor B family protein n=1 Tax=Colwellia polaris TaxID=326537 RepID=UPI000A16DA53|nr:choice-of-anchor B family protein [Colwellia polaris]
MFRITLIFVVSAALFYSDLAMAHSEHDKARFVAQIGKDTGKCDQVLRPCKSIAYAVQQANKGDKILVSAGEYTVSSSEELFYLKSALVPIFGGYNRFDHFQSQSPDTNPTELKNIPLDMAEQLREQGFIVLADGKSLFSKNSPEGKALQRKLESYTTLSEKQVDLACVDGKAGSFDCNNIDLLAHMPLSEFSSRPNSANDIWGHVDLNTGDEYALIGLRNGIAVINVTTPENPKEVGTISGLNSTWRDIKVYQYFDSAINAWQAYAYATVDGTTDYVTIINLNQLPNSVSLVEKNTVVTKAHNVYITNVDHTLNIALPGLTPTLQLIGSNKFGGAFHSYSLKTPATLTTLPNNYFGSGYTHDGASINITDNRKSSQCNTSNESCTVFIDFNEKEVKLWDITDASATRLLGTGEYNDVAKRDQYVHSGWGTEDKQHIFLHDEFDEKDGGLNSTVRIFSIADLNNPTQVGQWTGPTRAIDHNGFVRGNRYYMSNYERGLTVLDITDPANPETVGFFDTYTPSNNAGFNGAWGAYPFLPSGNILVSDIGSGLYILKDRTQLSTQGSLGFANNAIDTAQGETLAINVQRSNAASPDQTVSVNYQLLPGSAKANSDYTPLAGTLTWAANDIADKTIEVDIANDATGNELKEKFFVRLSQPSNSATLNQHSYLTVNIDGRNDSGAIAFTSASTTVAENQGEFSVTVARQGSSTGAVSVSYLLSAGTATIGEDVESASGIINWADGDSAEKSIQISIIDDTDDEANETFVIDLSPVAESNLGAITKYTVTISDDDSNSAPTVTVPEDSEINSGATISIAATATDTENDAMTYLWQQTAGANISLTTTTSLTTSFIAPASAGEITLSFTATDSKGLSSTQNVTFTVVVAPIATPSPTPPVESKSSGGGSIGYFILFIVILLTRKQIK